MMLFNRIVNIFVLFLLTML